MWKKLSENRVMKLFVLQFVTLFFSVIYGKLNAKFILPSEQGHYALQFGAMTFLHSLVIGPIINTYKANFNNTPNISLLTKAFIYLLLTIYLFVLLLAIACFFYFNNNTYLIVWATFTFQGFYTFSDEFLLLNFHYTKNSLMKIFYNMLLILLFVFIVILISKNTNQGLWLVLGGATLINFFVSASNSSKLFKNIIDSDVNNISKNQSLIFVTLKNFITFFKSYLAFNTSLIWSEVRKLVSTKALWQYILPLMALAIFGWISNYIDRYIIGYYLSPTAVGIYSVVYGLSSRTMLLATPFITYLSPIILSNKGQNLDIQISHKIIFGHIRYYILMAIVACIGMFFLKDWIGTFFLSQQYQSGFYLIPIISVGYVFFGCTFILETKFYAYQQTKYILYHNITGACLNLLLNLWLIPIFGLLGAALSTMMSTGVQLIFTIYLYRK